MAEEREDLIAQIEADDVPILMGTWYLFCLRKTPVSCLLTLIT
jgi:hypothetical protein